MWVLTYAAVTASAYVSFTNYWHDLALILTVLTNKIIQESGTGQPLTKAS